MNWVKIRRVAYLPAMAVLFVAAGLLTFLFRGQPAILAIIVVVLLLPGFIARRLLSDLLESRRLADRHDNLGGLAAAERFLAAQRERPWIRHAIWGAVGIYTLDPVAMAHNNAGVALLRLGRVDESQQSLEAARARDPAYPMPVFNLALVAYARGDFAEAEALGKLASEMGYPASGLDKLHVMISGAYATVPS